jgi:hypothetical protein
MSPGRDRWAERGRNGDVRKCAVIATVASGLLMAATPAVGSHRPPGGAFEPARLLPLPAPAVKKCKELQAGVAFTVLCPSRLPQARLHWRHGGGPPRLMTDFYGDRSHPNRAGLLGLAFGYGAAIEPQSGRWFWRRRAWLNRPAYFLHFTLFRQGPESLPSGLERRCFATRCGRIRYADGYGLRPGRGFYWANHTWFFWRERGTARAASLHYFGRPDTTILLARILERVVPADSL